MPFLKTVAERRLQPEIIDQPELAPDLLRPALCALERINWWSGSARIVWPPIRALARRLGPRPLRVLDLATGAGDVPIRLALKARHAGLPMHIAGCDKNAHAIAFAQERAADADVPVQFFVWDALQGSLPGESDVVMCSLFLHHLEERQAVAFLRKMAEAARQMVLVNDLVRSRPGFVLAYLGTRVLSGSPVVHTDGPRSVEGAFTIREAVNLAAQAGLEGAAVRRRWPCRYLLTWMRGHPQSARNEAGHA